MNDSIENRIPEAVNLGKFNNSVMSYIFCHYKEFNELKSNGLDLETIESDRYAMGFPIPNFQRPLVWTNQQEISLIESAWLGLPIGSFTHQHITNGADKIEKYSGLLIDGQQRLTTIERYINDEFKVYGAYWSELSHREQRRFKNVKFSHYETKFDSIDDIKNVYNIMALGGTPHTEADRVGYSKSMWN